MEWFTGGIGEAIQAAKAARGIFVVVVVNGDESHSASQTLLAVLNSEEVSCRLNLNSTIPIVAIRIEHGTPAGNQFSQLYPVILIPSVYFIDSTTGVDIEVTGGEVTKEKFLESIDKAIEKMQASLTAEPAAPVTIQSPAVASAARQEVTPNDVTSPRGQRVEQARQTLRDAAPEAMESTPSTSSSEASAALSLEERVARAKQLLAERQAQKAREEEQAQKAKERERRELGQTLVEQKRKRDEEAMIKAAEERRKDKEEEKLAREKIKAQIAQDREDRAARFNATKQAELEAKAAQEKRLREEESAEAQRLAAERCQVARVQYRYPDGRSKTKIFPAEAPLQEVYDFANEEVAATFGRDNFTLSTTYPARQLDKEPRNAPLRDVGLVPSGTVMIIPRGGSNLGALTPSAGNILSYVWLLLTPVTFLWNIVLSFFSPSPPASAGADSGDVRRSVAEKRAGAAEKRQAAEAGSSGGAIKRPSTAYQRRTPSSTSGGIRKDGNIARLGGDDDDSEDETNTYNGNSTQQM